MIGLQEMHTSNEEYVKTKRDHINTSEQQLLATRSKTQQVHLEVTNQTNALRQVCDTMDQLVHEAKQLEPYLSPALCSIPNLNEFINTPLPESSLHSLAIASPAKEDTDTLSPVVIKSPSKLPSKIRSTSKIGSRRRRFM